MNTKFALIVLLGNLIYAKSQAVILTPKQSYNTFNFNLFSKEHNLEKLAEFNNYVYYTTSENNYNTFSQSFSELFDIEKEQEYTVNPVHMSDSKVVFVQQPNEVYFQLETPWHLDRITKPQRYNYTSCHTNKTLTINTYIIDTGIDVTHPEFEGRAVFLENFTGDGFDTDKNGHGTHCSGAVGSKSYGVCKDAKLFGVKVLDAHGSGSTSGVLKGMEYVFNRHLNQLKTNKNVKSIVSMSLGGGYSAAINKAAETMIQNDSIFFAAAAGNENQSACNSSPASAKGIFTVMAMDKMDNRAYFSNFGKCTDMYSPGVDIESTIPDGKTAIYSGTSMATPLLVSVMNHYVNKYPELNMKGIKEKMLSDATKNVIKKNPNDTPNLMVHLPQL